MGQPSIACASTGLLGDTAARNYGSKLSQFNAFARPELMWLIGCLRLSPGMRVLDAGCGTGEALQWLWQAVEPAGQVVGLDLAAAHVAKARTNAPRARLYEADILDAPLEPASFDFIWCVNTINHLKQPELGVRRLKALLKQGGRMAIGQSSLLPDMFFAWDSRLERLTNEAVRQFYRERYGLDERDLTSVRALVGLVRRAELKRVSSRTLAIERIAPVDADTDTYLQEAIFRDTWGERLRPYLSPDDFAELTNLCEPRHEQFALRRPDFHFLQSFTLVTGEL